VRLTVQVRLLPDTETIEKLEATMHAFNEAADWLAGEAFALHSANKIALQKTHYAQLRERFGLSAQMAVRCIAQVCEAYKRDKDVRPHFRPFASVPYDARLMSFKGIDRVSLLTMEGRVLVPFIMGAYQRERFSAAKGQCDLVRRRDGKWFLLVCIDLPERTKLPTSDFIGVDFGVVNIATTSDGDSHSGEGIERCRVRYDARRRSLQVEASRQCQVKRRPKNVRRALRRCSGKEAGFRRDVNHCISKTIVVQAKDTNRGIAL
jgi:predicted transposase